MKKIEDAKTEAELVDMEQEGSGWGVICLITGQIHISTQFK